MVVTGFIVIEFKRIKIKIKQIFKYLLFTYTYFPLLFSGSEQRYSLSMAD